LTIYCANNRYNY